MKKTRDTTAFRSTETAEEHEAPAPEGRCSYPLATGWLLFALLLILPPVFGRAWVTGLALAFYIVLCGLFLYTALDRSAFEKAKAACRGLTRSEWLLHYLFLLAVVPGVLLCVLLYARFS
jgi:hypothetical protein